jgi:hypothetical protein
MNKSNLYQWFIYIFLGEACITVARPCNCIFISNNDASDIATTSDDHDESESGKNLAIMRCREQGASGKKGRAGLTCSPRIKRIKISRALRKKMQFNFYNYQVGKK